MLLPFIPVARLSREKIGQPLWQGVKMEQYNRVSVAADKLNIDDAWAPGRFGPQACRALPRANTDHQKAKLNL